MLVVTMPLGGISGGTQSILSYNYGAKHIRRVRQAQRRIIGLCVGYAAILQLLAWVAGPAFVRLFTADAEVAREAVRAIRVCTLMLLPLGVQYEIVDGFTAMGLVRYCRCRSGASSSILLRYSSARRSSARRPPSSPSRSPTCLGRS